jgi:KUP system potassium uptake protein
MEGNMSSPDVTLHPQLIQKRALAPLVVGAIGVVYGDIGTSPLYALKECFNPEHGIVLNASNVLGILSLIFWSLTIIVSGKYVALVMRADNNGEGGILSLLALALRATKSSPRWRLALISAALFGGSMFYGDSMITPAISVLSAVEGIEIATPVFSPYVLPITLALITGLFVMQSRGAGPLGNLFGPICAVWFAAIGAGGVAQILHNPSVLEALNPIHAALFLSENPVKGFFVLGSIFLVLTGAEALYADMGHFGKKPIRMAWFGLVFPALILNYFGQGALVLANPEAIKNPFYLMFPDWALIPMVVLATLATVIASQAVISGAFSLTSMAIKMGYVPRMAIEHTSHRQMGQIYIPFVNWALFVCVVALVLGFKTSSSLANAYGIAVAGTMIATTFVITFVARRVWGWSLLTIAAVMGPLAVIDVAYFAANTAKVMQGGWFPLVVGALLYTLLVTWKKGRSLVFQRLAEQGIPLVPFVKALAEHPPQRVEGTAVFMTSNPDTVPHALLHNLKHNRVLHERVVFLTIVTQDVPVVPVEDRVQLEAIGEGFYRMQAWYGFKEEPNLSEVLNRCKPRYKLDFDMMDTSFFLSRETVIPAELPGMSEWRDHLFAWMSRNAMRATDYYQIPANRVVELGTHVEI